MVNNRECYHYDVFFCLFSYFFAGFVFGKFMTLTSENIKKKGNKEITSIHLIPQSMEAGLGGMHGQLAANPVNPGHKPDREAARSHRPKMAEKHVQERHENSGCATRIHVRVWKCLVPL